MIKPVGYRELIKEDLKAHADPEKAVFLTKFFKAVPGGYGEGDLFMGVMVPAQRQIARKYFQDIELDDLACLLKDAVHEHRLTALFILVYKFEKAKTEEARKAIVDFYVGHLEHVNNWDLVDSSADKILGAYLFHKDKDVLYQFALSGDLWRQRVAIISTFYFIRKNSFNDTLRIAQLLLRHEHDLIHKAIGWMLREIGKRNFEVEYKFLREHYTYMPRTMLRYAIEKFDPDLRQKFLKGRVNKI